MMVHPGEAKILKGKGFEALHTLLGRQHALAYVFQEAEDVFFLHRSNLDGEDGEKVEVRSQKSEVRSQKSEVRIRA
jgi:hypothetical protein